MTTDFEPGRTANTPDAAALPSEPATPAPANSTLLSRVAVWVLAFGLAFGALAGAFIGGMAYERNVVAGSDGASDDPINVFDVAWDTVLNNYVEEAAIDPDAMLEGAIEGMLATLGDQGHTRYLTAEETELDRQSSRGVYQGVGVQVREDEEDGLVVTRVFPESPAMDAGVLAGDIVRAVDGEDITDLPLDAIIAMIRGPEGSQVDVTFYRPSTEEETTYELERREIEVSAVSWEMLDDNIGLLKLSQFSERAGDDLTLALEAAQEEGAEGIILDLRGNPGGLVREALEVAALFVPDDAPVYISQTRDGGEDVHTADQGAVYIGDLPFVVLVDGGTASASEIVTGSIKAEAENGTVIGEQTVGTGTVLRRFELGDGSTMWLGIELWLTPEGDMIREQGITPDVIVPLPDGQVQYVPVEFGVNTLDPAEDDQLSYALDLLLGRHAYYPIFDFSGAPEQPW